MSSVCISKWIVFVFIYEISAKLYYCISTVHYTHTYTYLYT